MCGGRTIKEGVLAESSVVPGCEAGYATCTDVAKSSSAAQTPPPTARDDGAAMSGITSKGDEIGKAVRAVYANTTLLVTTGAGYMFSDENKMMKVCAATSLQHVTSSVDRREESS